MPRTTATPTRIAAAVLLLASLPAAASAATDGTTTARAASAGNDPNLKMHVHGTSRATDLRVGEQLGFGYHHGHGVEKIVRICWDPAPIDQGRCSSLFGAPAHTGTQRVTAKLEDGTFVHASYDIGPAVPASLLPATYDDAMLPTAHEVLYRATCDAAAHEELHHDGRERPAPRAFDVKTGDHLAVLSRAHVDGYLNAIDLRAGHYALDYAARCLQPVHASAN